MKTVIQFQNFSIKEIRKLRVELPKHPDLYRPEAPIIVEGSTFGIGDNIARVVTISSMDESYLKRAEGIVIKAIKEVIGNLPWVVICSRAQDIKTGGGGLNPTK